MLIKFHIIFFANVTNFTETYLSNDLIFNNVFNYFFISIFNC